MKKIPKEQHKKRVLIFVDPNIIDNIGKQKCQEVAKESIAKEHKKFLRFNKLK